MVQDRPFVSAKPLGLGVVREMPSLLAEFSGAQTRGACPESCRRAQTMPALFLKSVPRLGHAEWAVPKVRRAMRDRPLSSY
jgi:hypothetical protein